MRLAAVVAPVVFVLNSLRLALGGSGAAWMTWAGACCRGVLYGYCGTMAAILGRGRAHCAAVRGIVLGKQTSSSTMSSIYGGPTTFD